MSLLFKLSSTEHSLRRISAWVWYTQCAILSSKRATLHPPMCLVLFSYQPDSPYTLIVAANRDEFYARPARSAHHWADAPHLLAGRDLSAGGTWLGVSTSHRFAAVTNFAEDTPGDAAPCSRGALVEEFLKGNASAHDFAHQIHGADYRGFNLLLFDSRQLFYTSNRGHTEHVGPGVYGLANAELGARWPKVVDGVASLKALREEGPSTSALIKLLSDKQVPADEQLPKRGRSIEFERQVAPCFIRGEEYGTRASTAVIIQPHQTLFAEQIYSARGAQGGPSEFTLPA